MSDINTKVSTQEKKRMRKEKKEELLEEEEEEATPALLCAHCRTSLAGFDEILSHRTTDAWAAHVYAYELDIFSNKPPFWCYSATNPQERRFDLVRCDVAIAARRKRVELRGLWSSEHTFFVGHEWCYAMCGACNAFLGWGFRRVAAEADTTAKVTDTMELISDVDSVSFIGLILTRCVSSENTQRHAKTTAVNRVASFLSRHALQAIGFYPMLLRSLNAATDTRERLESLTRMLSDSDNEESVADDDSSDTRAREGQDNDAGENDSQ